MSKQRAQRVAIIDLGSNTNCLVVLNTQVGYSYRLEDKYVKWCVCAMV